MTSTTSSAKNAARALRADLARSGLTISHGQALELVAHQLGHRDWNTAAAALDHAPTGVGVGAPVPVLRIQDEAIARAFYLDHLGFTVD